MRGKAILTTAFVLTVLATLAWQIDSAKGQAVTKGLVSHWTFDQADMEGDTVKDVGGDNDGTIAGDPQIVQGKVHQALEFDGVGDYIGLPASAINDLDGGTIEAWIKLDSNNEETITAKQHNGVNTYAIFSVGYLGNPAGWPDPNTAGKLYFHARNDINASSSSTLDNEQWYHVALTFDTSEANFYIDGSLDDTVDGDFSVPADLNPTATSIGAWLGDGGGKYFSGAIDEVRIYDRALSEAEVAQNFKGGTSVNSKNKLALTWGKIKVSR